MANEPIYNVIKSEMVKKIASGQIVVEARLYPEGGTTAKVLAVNAQACINSVETVNGEARYFGKTVFKVLYLTADGKYASGEAVTEFNDKLESDCVTPLVEAVLTADVLDTDTLSATAGEIRVQAVVEIRGIVISGEQLNYLASGGDDLYTQTDKIGYDVMLAKAFGEIAASGETSAKGADSILTSEASAILKSAYCGMDCIVAEGSVNVFIVYLTPEGEINSKTLSFDFSQEFEASGVRPEDTVLGDLTLRRAATILERFADDTEGIAKSDVILAFRGYAFKSMDVDAVVDAFSVSHEIMLTGEGCEVGRYFNKKPLKTKIEGTATLTDANADTVLVTCAGRVNVANAYSVNGKVTLEGVVNANVIYLDASTDVVGSVVVEVPYSASFDCDCEGEIIAHGDVVSISALARRGTDIEITAEVIFNIGCYTRESRYFLKEVEFVAPRTGMSAIAIHIVRDGESLWDVAKSLATTPEVILAQNTGLKVPFTGGERVLVYRQRRAE